MFFVTSCDSSLLFYALEKVLNLVALFVLGLFEWDRAFAI